jgi:hypothetical protein
MYATEIDKVRKKIVRNGFKPREKGSTTYYTDTRNAKSFVHKVGTIEVTEFSYITIDFKNESYFNGKTFTDEKHWYVKVTVMLGSGKYEFKFYTYLPNIVDDIFLKIRQYIAFEEFLKL